MAATVAVTSLSEGVLVHVEQGWLSGKVVRVRPSLIAELCGRRYSVDAQSVLQTWAPPFLAAGACCRQTGSDVDRQQIIPPMLR